MFTLRRIISFIRQNLRYLVFTLFVILAGVSIYNGQRITLDQLGLTVKSPNRLRWNTYWDGESYWTVLPNVWFDRQLPGQRGINIHAVDCDETQCNLEDLVKNVVDDYPPLDPPELQGLIGIADLMSGQASLIDETAVTISAPAACDASARTVNLGFFTSIITTRVMVAALDCNGRYFLVRAYGMGRHRDGIERDVNRFVGSIELVE